MDQGEHGVMIPDDGRGGPAIRPPFPEQPLPATGCVPWRPAVQELAPPDTDACTILVAPQVLTAVEDQLHSGPDQGLVGFLVGRVLTNPATGLLYVVIDRAMPVPRLSVAGGSDRLATQSLAAVQRLVQPGAAGEELVGWYRTQPSGEPRISAEDHDAHVRSFPQAWHVALVVAGGSGGPKGGVFRPVGDPGSPVPYLPFFELVEAAGLSVMSWTNYWSPNPPPRSAAAERTFSRPAAPVRRIVISDAADASDDDPALRRRTRHRDEPDRSWRWWVAAAVVVIVATVTLEEWWLHRATLTSDVVTASDSSGAVPAITPEPVRRAIAAYRQRASLFANQQMTCADLAPGLADVDDEWLRYVRAAPPALDRTLATEVEAVEADFERTGCPRP
jgi:hypothetical protein